MLASTPGNPTTSDAMVYAVATLARSIAQGAGSDVLRGVNLDRPGTGGGGGGGIAAVLPPPTVTAVTPSNGPGNTPITITGTDFAPGTTVTVGGVTATDVVVVDET